jgi:predicted site-specific integrase-resolvase
MKRQTTSSRETQVHADRIDAVYVRKSSDPQEEQSQIDAIEAYLARHNIRVRKEHWFSDTGSRHRPQDRPDFQRLLDLVNQGRVRRVFIWKQDRFVSGVRLWFHYLFQFEQAGTQLIDILTGADLAADDIATEITTAVKARGDREEQHKISANTLRAKVSLAREGMPISKLPPYGYDKKYTDARGQHLWTAHVITAGAKKGQTKYAIITPDGTRQERDIPPRKHKTDRITYVPSADYRRVETVKYIFATFASESVTASQLAKRLNGLGMLHYGKPWLRVTVEDVLQNPAYIGSVRLNKTSRGEFTRYDGEQLIPAANPDRKMRRNSADQQIVVPEKHEPLIDQPVWERVQEKLNGREHRPRPPRQDDLWLRGVLVCAACGKPMHVGRTGKTKGYVCASYYMYNQTRSPQHNTGCARNWVSHADAERLVLDKVGDMADRLKRPEDRAVRNELVHNFLSGNRDIELLLMRAVGSYLTGMERLFEEANHTKRLRDIYSPADRVRRSIRDAELADRIAAHADEDLSPERAKKLFVLFEEEKVVLAKKKVAELKEEYSVWVRAKGRAEHERELQTVRERLAEIDDQLRVWEERLIPLEDRLAELRATVAERERRLEEYWDILGGNNNRRKAEVVREMFSAVAFHFRQVKRTKAVLSILLPDATEFRVNLKADSSPRSCRRSPGPAPTGTPRPRATRRRSRSR